MYTEVKIAAERCVDPYDQVKDHFHYAGKYKGVVHNKWSLKYIYVKEFNENSKNRYANT